MPSEPEVYVPLALLDRLTDSDPANSRERPPSAFESSRELQESLCRDLTALLNTRRRKEEIDPGYAESAESLLAFGVPDFTMVSLKNPAEQDLVRRSLERAIRQFEPRLTRITVLLEPVRELEPLLRFRVEAVLRLEPVHTPVSFDAVLHGDIRRFTVRWGQR